MGKKEILLLTAILSAVLPFISEYITFEAIFPGLICYHLFTFTLSYPKAQNTRKLFINLALCFTDIAFTALLFQSSITLFKFCVWMTEFIIIFIIISLRKVKEVYKALAGTNLRYTLFLIASYIRSTSLASFISYYYCTATDCASDKPIDLNWLILASIILLSTIKVMLTPLIYLLDNFYWTRDSKILTLKEFFSRFESGIGAILIALAAVMPYQGKAISALSLNPLFSTQFSYPKLIANAYYFIWYGFEAVDYGAYFKKDAIAEPQN